MAASDPSYLERKNATLLRVQQKLRHKPFSTRTHKDVLVYTEFETWRTEQQPKAHAAIRRGTVNFGASDFKCRKCKTRRRDCYRETLPKHTAAAITNYSSTLTPSCIVQYVRQAPRLEPRVGQAVVRGCNAKTPA